MRSSKKGEAGWKALMSEVYGHDILLYVYPKSCSLHSAVCLRQLLLPVLLLLSAGSIMVLIQQVLKYFREAGRHMPWTADLELERQLRSVVRYCVVAVSAHVLYIRSPKQKKQILYIKGI